MLAPKMQQHLTVTPLGVDGFVHSCSTIDWCAACKMTTQASQNFTVSTRIMAYHCYHSVYKV